MTDHSAIKKQRRYTFDSLEREYSYRRVSGLAYATAGIYRSILEQAAKQPRRFKQFRPRVTLTGAGHGFAALGLPWSATPHRGRTAEARSR